MPGYLKEGVWCESNAIRNDEEGNYFRLDSQFRNVITDDGSSGYRAEPDRYHLYVSYACPWAHRTLLARTILGLQEYISYSIVNPVSTQCGWTFSPYEGSTVDHVNGFSCAYSLYTATDPYYTGLVTVPILWDKKTKAIVNNESSEIVRMLNDSFTTYRNVNLNLYPPSISNAIDSVNEFIYKNINNGVYKCGFAKTQSAYEESVNMLFAALETVDACLKNSKYLMGDVLTESDIRLFPTLIRFDAVYYIHFKCCLRRISDFKNISRYINDVLNIDGVRETVNIKHIKAHYYLSHPDINPTGIVPVGPLDQFVI